MPKLLTHGTIVAATAPLPANLLARSTEQPIPFMQLFPGLVGPKPDPVDLVTLQDRMRDTNAADNDSQRTPAGFTFFGQFIDHDLTLTGVARAADAEDFGEFRKELPISELRNLRTAELELDSVFGQGPEAAPAIARTLFRDPPHDLRLRTGAETHQASWDLAREQPGANGLAPALIGDGRNDENKLVAQVHLAFVRAYNRLYEQAAGTPTERYIAARRSLTESYHHILVHDYLRRFVPRPLLESVLMARAARWRAANDAAEAARQAAEGAAYQRRVNMPVEFAFALFRFGHSQVRDGYRLNATTAVPTFSDFAPADLSGLQPIPATLAWDHRLFFDDDIGKPGYVPPARMNFSRRIDTRLSASLFGLKPPAVDPEAQERSLARRNLQRARLIGLPSGEQCAQALGLPVLTPQQLGVDDLAGVRGRTPLWYYILAEAELGGGEQLGPLGGTILAETIIGILSVSEGSFYRNRDWDAAPANGIRSMRQLTDFAAGG